MNYLYQIEPTWFDSTLGFLLVVLIITLMNFPSLPIWLGAGVIGLILLGRYERCMRNKRALTAMFGRQ